MKKKHQMVLWITHLLSTNEPLFFTDISLQLLNSAFKSFLLLLIKIPSIILHSDKAFINVLLLRFRFN